MIIPPQPIEVTAKVADGLWITNLSINAPTATEPVRVMVNVVPFVSQTGELITDQRRHLEVADLYALAATDPDVAAAIQSLYGILQKWINEQGLFNPPAETAPSTETPSEQTTTPVS